MMREKKTDELHIIQVFLRSEATCSKNPISIDFETEAKYSLLSGMQIFPATRDSKEEVVSTCKGDEDWFVFDMK